MKTIVLIISIAIMNALDAFSTVRYLKMGKMDEANPLMKMIIDSYGTNGLIVFKLTVINALLLLLFFNRKNKITKKGIILISIVYFTLILWHCVGLLI